MIITCGKCQAKFKVAPEQIKETGSKVRCSNCKYVFTVFRPQRPLEIPKRSSQEDGIGDYLSGLDGDSSRNDFKYGLKNFYGGDSEQSPARAYSDESYGLDDSSDSDDGPHVCSPGDSLSMKERRDRRRQMYSDLDDESGRSEYDDCLDDAFDDDGDDEPNLRRGRKTKAEAQLDDDSDSLEEELVDEALGQMRGNMLDDGTLDARLPRASSGDGLGLSADPAGVGRIVDDGRSYPSGFGVGLGHHEPTTIRAAITKAEKRRPTKLILGLFILAAILAAAFYFISNRPAATSLVSDEIVDNTGQTDNEVGSGSTTDNVGKDLISFANKQEHYFRDNRQGGKLLVIVGKVYNGYPDDRSFIRLRGILEDQDGENLSERYIYAGNILSEEDLTGLPVNEITSRLNVKAGQDRQNMNVKPGQGIDFMFVFDKLPPDMAGYRIISVGSSPADN